METLELKNFLPVAIILLAIFLANATAKTMVTQDVSTSHGVVSASVP
jgi:hypothetical protein